MKKMNEMILILLVMPLFAFSYKSVTNIGATFDNNVYKSTVASTPVSVGVSVTQSILLFGKLNNATYYKSAARINYFGFRNQNLNNRYSVSANGSFKRYLSPFLNVSVSPGFYYNNFVNDTMFNSSRISGFAAVQWLPGDIFAITFSGRGEKYNYLNYKINDNLKYGANIAVSADIGYSASVSANAGYFKKEYKNSFIIYDSTGRFSGTKYRIDNTTSLRTAVEWFPVSNIVLDANAGVTVSKTNRNYFYLSKVINNYYDYNAISAGASALYFIKKILIYPYFTFRQTYSKQDARDKNYKVTGNKIKGNNISISLNTEIRMNKITKLGVNLGFADNTSNDYYSNYKSVSGGIYTILNF